MIEMKPLDIQTNDLAEELVGRYCRDLSKGTLKKYQANYLRLDGRDWQYYSIEHQLKQNTAQVYRAAWCFHHAYAIKRILERLRTETDIEHRHTLNLFLLAKVTELEDGRSLCYSPAVRRKKKSKRKSLHGKPGNWRECILGALAEPYKVYGIVTALTGCRPSELGKGASVTIINQELIIEILGAKVSDITEGGQPFRRLTINQSLPLARELLAIMESQETRELYVKTSSYSSWYRAFKRAAKSLGWGDLSPYSYRHQLSADLKALGQNNAFLSKVLGHRSSRSRSNYGQFLQGRSKGGSGPITEVYAPLEVRIYDSQFLDETPSTGPSLG
ncbi:hypothetical protein SAMN04487962_15110 [Marinobacter segnicrescens]|uniref:Phage integrase family protein n=1 Tax=Marinobacter segnicrescens TaxID=430453 RepID=A0A1I0ICD1_9GAMM|nr:hypothetical protein [Marinobacter segnicrescens]SET93573.1 hypothetical protein SAMN04487962_15110 [Marinobacter segnicrescens]